MSSLSFIGIFSPDYNHGQNQGNFNLHNVEDVRIISDALSFRMHSKMSMLQMCYIHINRQQQQRQYHQQQQKEVLVFVGTWYITIFNTFFIILISMAYLQN